MTKPTVINWQAASATYVSPVTTYSNNQPVPFTLSVPYTNGFTGVTTNQMSLPHGNNRILSFSVAGGNPTDQSVVISGVDSYGTFHTEIVDLEPGPDAYMAYSVNAYNKIYNMNAIIDIGPLILSVGIAGGSVAFQMIDVWNKTAQTTIAYDNVNGTVSLTPSYMIQPLLSFVHGQPVYNNPSNVNTQPVPVENTNIIVSPSTIVTLPITTDAYISMNGVPMSALGTFVSNTTTGSFTQTILQQGAKF